MAGSSSLPRERAVIGQQQQPFRGEVEPADRDHARQAGRQGVEDGGAAALVAVRGHQAGGLVVAEQPRALRLRDGLAVDASPCRPAATKVAGVSPRGLPLAGPAPRRSASPRRGGWRRRRGRATWRCARRALGSSGSSSSGARPSRARQAATKARKISGVAPGPPRIPGATARRGRSGSRGAPRPPPRRPAPRAFTTAPSPGSPPPGGARCSPPSAAGADDARPAACRRRPPPRGPARCADWAARAPARPGRSSGMCWISVPPKATASKLLPAADAEHRHVARRAPRASPPARNRCGRP